MILAKTFFSLRYGILSPEALLSAATERGLRRLVLCDNNSVSAAAAFVRCCQQAGIQPILGVDFRDDSNQSLYYGIAFNEAGFYELNAFLSEQSLQPKKLPAVAPTFQHAAIVYTKRPKAIQYFRELEFLGIRAQDLHRLPNSGLLDFPDKLLAYQPACFLNSKEDRVLHQLLRAIDLNLLISQVPNSSQAKPEDELLYPQQMKAAYAPYPFLLRNAAKLLARCSISLQQGPQNNRQCFSSSEADDFALLQKLAYEGCQKRYGSQQPTASLRLKKELQLIQSQGFCPYFLITWDMIRYAKSAGFHHVGRGSGANSLVAYCLGITDVDPLQLNLYFERFINEFRSSPPDFDIDFSWRERDEVIDYLFKRYGRHYVGLLATYNTFKGRSCIREIGKAYGLPKTEIDELCRAAKPSESDALIQTIYQLADRLHGLPNYLSIHAGGILISQRPLYYHSALKATPKGFPIVHFDMHEAEMLGFHKFDVLSQRGLGHIREAIEIVAQTESKVVDIHNIPKILQDPAVLSRLQSASCIGCFYIESPAMRSLLSKIRCDHYLALVAASSVIRPGVAQSGMMQEYIRRSLEPHSFNYPHPIFEEHLSETHGIMVYQEDVMRIAHHFAGLELAESDVLRRLISGKRSPGDTLDKLRDKYFLNCQARGYSEELAQEIWQQIESFAGYSFCKAHSASYAVESFQSLYLKVHHPHAFIVAVINNGGGFYPLEFYVREAIRQGADVQAPCLNHSELYAALKADKLIYLGLAQIANLAPAIAKKICAIRQAKGHFRSLEDFLHKSSEYPGEIPSKVCDLLIQVGAFRFTAKSKATLYWEKNAFLAEYAKLGSGAEEGDLFPLAAANGYPLPDLTDGPYDQAFDEIALLGFPLCSPFSLLAELPEAYKSLPKAADLPTLAGQTIQILGYFVCRKEVRTSQGKYMQFSTWLDQHDAYFDGVHFPAVLASAPLRGPGIYLLRGKVVLDFNFPQLEISHCQRLPLRPDDRWC